MLFALLLLFLGLGVRASTCPCVTMSGSDSPMEGIVESTGNVSGAAAALSDYITLVSDASPKSARNSRPTTSNLQ